VTAKVELCVLNIAIMIASVQENNASLDESNLVLLKCSREFSIYILREFPSAKSIHHLFILLEKIGGMIK
jgi:hypothetical protein